MGSSLSGTGLWAPLRQGLLSCPSPLGPWPAHQAGWLPLHSQVGGPLWGHQLWGYLEGHRLAGMASRGLCSQCPLPQTMVLVDGCVSRLHMATNALWVEEWCCWSGRVLVQTWLLSAVVRFCLGCSSSEADTSHSYPTQSLVGATVGPSPKQVTVSEQLSISNH